MQGELDELHHSNHTEDRTRVEDLALKEGVGCKDGGHRDQGDDKVGIVVEDPDLKNRKE